MTIPTDTQWRDFLLRRLPVPEAARLEEAIILEDGVAERVRCEEFDLIDDYAAGRLIAKDCADVEQYLLASVENRGSLRMARLLTRERAQREAARPGWTATPTPAARARRRSGRLQWMGVLIAAGLTAVVLLPHWGRTLGPPIGVSSTATSSTQAAAGASRFPTEAPQSIPILTLLADVTRGTSGPTLHWKADLGSVRLQAEIPGPEHGTLYAITVYNTAGQRLFEAAGTAHTAGRYRFIDTVVPAKALGPGSRIVSLRAADAAAAAPAAYTWQVLAVLD